MCIQDRILLGPTGFPITSGDSGMNFHGCTPCRLPRAFPRSTGWRHLSTGLILLNLVACSVLDPIGNPRMSDLELMVDVLNGSLKDAQHTMAELRAEVEVRNQELAETQVIRAQLEGRVREAEHRLSEARHLIGLQREELAEYGADRERIARAGAVLQNQLKRLRKQRSRSEKSASGGVVPMIMDLSVEKPLRSAPVGMKETGSFDDPLDTHQVHPQLDGVMSDTGLVGRGVTQTQPLAPAMHTRVMIKPGDTLWSLAHRYHTSVPQLMAINALATDYIQAGQSLWLPESVADEPEYGPR